MVHEPEQNQPADEGDEQDLAAQLRQARRTIAQLEGRLAEADNRQRALLAESPLGFWEYDLSAVHTKLKRLWPDGPPDDAEALERALAQEIPDLLGRFRLLFVNQAGLDIFQATNAKDFSRNFHRLMTTDSGQTLIRSLAAMAGGKTNMLADSQILDRRGRHHYVSLFWAIPPGSRHDWSRVLVSALDISPRKDAEMALRESEHRHRALFHESPNIMWLVDPSDGSFVDVNQTACDFYGYSRQQFLAMRIGDINLLGSAKVAPALQLAAIGDKRRFEFQHRLANGQVRDVEVYTGVIALDGKHLVYSTIHDITQSKKALEDLRTAERNYRSIYENSLAGIMRTTPDGRLLAANPALARIFGYPDPATMMLEVTDVGRQMYADPEQRRRFMEKIMADGQVADYTMRIRRRDGSLGWGGLTARAVRDPQGQLMFVEGFLDDATEKVEAKEALSRSEALYRAIVDNSLSAIYIFQDDKMVFVNRAFCDMLGSDGPEAVLGKPFWEFIHPADQQWVAHRARRRAEGEEITPHYSFRCVKLSGEIIWVDMQATRIVHQGQPAVMGNLINITESKILNEKLAQAQKMEAVGTLASGIAHDFNNILQTISGYAQMDDESRQGQGPNHLREINVAVERAAELINRLLAFSRNIEPQLKPVSLNDEVTQTLRILERTIPKMIAIEVDLEPDLPLVNGDSIQLEQVIMNLAANARDAMPDGGRLLLKTASVRLDGEFCRSRPELPPGRYVMLTVADSGQGMDQATMDQIFDPFFSTKEIGRGAGLGLSQVYGTIKNHRGHIECESAPGRGARFQIYLPAMADAPLAQRPPRAPAAKPPGGKSEKVLLVDDEKAILDVGSHILRDNGYTVLTAESGEQALQALERNKDFDLVVLDLGMPGMGGRRCLEQIIQRNPRQKVIVASGYSDDDSRQRALDHGATAFLPKPYRLPELLRLARRVIDGAIDR